MTPRTTVTPGGGRLSLGIIRGVDVVRHDLMILDLTPAFDGLRVVHLTDLHAHRHWHRGWSRVLDWLGQNPPDVICFTGDFVEDKLDHRPAWRLVEKFCAGLNARLGVYAILGNHDSDLVALHGLPPNVTLLHGRSARVPLDTPSSPPVTSFPSLAGSQGKQADPLALDLVGLPGVHRDDLTETVLRSFPPKRRGDLRIVLSHYPDAVRKLAPLNADLVLAGHTHGGQICRPRRRPLITHDSLPFDQAAGIHRHGNAWLVVNRGLGFSGYALRTFCPAEVGEIVLRAGHANQNDNASP